MNERLVTIPIPATYPGASAALGDNFAYYLTQMDLTIVGVTVAPSADDSGLTVDINDDGTGVITGVDASDQNVPGTWKAKGYGGANDPVHVEAGSKLSFDANNAANGTSLVGFILALTSEKFS